MGSTSTPQRLNTTDELENTISASEVDTIIQTVQQAAKVDIGTGEREEEEDWQASYYWDASTMSPFNAASLVSGVQVQSMPCLNHIAHDKPQGCYCPAESL